jgi:hypothetical protein
LAMFGGSRRSTHRRKTGYDRPARSRRSRPPPVLRRSPEACATPAPRGQKPPPNRRTPFTGTAASPDTRGSPRDREASDSPAPVSGRPTQVGGALPRLRD